MMEKIKPFLQLVWSRKRMQYTEIDKLFQNTKKWEEYEAEILDEDANSLLNT